MNKPIKVSVKQDDYGTIIVDSGEYELPLISALLPLFTSEEQLRIKHHASYGYTIEAIISRTLIFIPLQRWSDVIADYLHVQESNKLGGHSEIGESAVTYMVEGDTVYELKRSRVIDPDNALQSARDVILDAARRESAQLVELANADYTKRMSETQVESARIITDARTSASMLVQDAERRRREATRILSDAKGTLGPPEWASAHGYVMKRDSGGTWHIRFEATVKLRGFDTSYNDENDITRNFSWEALPDGRPKIVQMWMPILNDGGYGITTMYMDQGSISLPHTNHGGSCMGLNGAPEKILSDADMRRFITGVERVHTRAQLDSLYTPPAKWRKAFQSAIPEDLYQVLTGSNYANRVRRLARSTAEAGRTPGTARRDEHREVWTVPGA